MANKSKSGMAKFSTHTAEVQHHDGPLLIPNSMTPTAAYQMLGQMIMQQEEKTEFSLELECLPYDGAAALNSVLVKEYGWSSGIPTPGFFGDTPPKMITIETDHNTSIQVPWGRMSLPNLDSGFVQTSIYPCNGIACFRLTAVCKRKDEKFIKEKIFQALSHELRDFSIYKGKCFSISFTDSNNEDLKFPDIKFIDLSGFKMENLILPEDITRNLDLSAWTPMRHHEEFRKNHGNLKRGILMAGGYGTGKTLSTSNTAKLGVDLGFTVVYCKKTTEFEKALRIARNYQNPCAVLIVEDIDIELAAGRTDALNQIINTLDGMDTKNDNIITLMTTNDIESLEPAAIRQGRVSAKVLFRNPDAHAAERLIRVNAKGLLPESEDLTEAAKLMDGMNPAEIEEIVTMAELAHLSDTGEGATSLNADDIKEAALYMQSQAEIQRSIEKIHENPEVTTVDKLISNIVELKVPTAKQVANEVVTQMND